jgi:hypothetical protein
VYFRLPGQKSTSFCFDRADTQIKYWNGSVYSNIQAFTAGTYYILGTKVDSADTSYFKAIVNSGSENSGVTFNSAESNLIGAYCSEIGGNEKYGYLDWILVRQWAITEPAWGTWGAEQAY